MTKINYKSDFDFILKLQAIGADGEAIEVGFPDYDFEVILTAGASCYASRTFVASCIKGVAKNCFNDNGQLHIVCDNHKLNVGELHAEFKAYLPNDIYPDGNKLSVRPQPIDIELVTDHGDDPTTNEVELVLPYAKGDKGDKGDTGESGVHIGNAEPTSDANIWIDISKDEPQSINEIAKAITDVAVAQSTSKSLEFIQEQNYQNEEQVKDIVNDTIVKVEELTLSTYTIKPNKFYVFPTANEIVVNLEEATDVSRYNEYMFQFTSNDYTTLTLPTNIKWIGGNSEVEPNMTYQVSIVNNIAVMGGVGNEQLS